MARSFCLLLAGVFVLAGCKGRADKPDYGDEAAFSLSSHHELVRGRLPDTFYAVDEWSGEEMSVLSYIYMKIYADSIVWEEGHVRVDVMFSVVEGHSGNY